MTTILASPARQLERVGSRSAPNVEAAARARRAPQAALAAQDALEWLIDACVNHLAAAPRPTRAALVAHLVASAGYPLSDGFDAEAHNMRVDLAQSIAARLQQAEHSNVSSPS